MARPRHPSKDIDEAVKYAEQHGWTFTKPGARAHAWGRLRCPHGERGGCQLWVYGTPRDPVAHARQIRRRVDDCPH